MRILVIIIGIILLLPGLCSLLVYLSVIEEGTAFANEVLVVLAPGLVVAAIGVLILVLAIRSGKSKTADNEKDAQD